MPATVADLFIILHVRTSDKVFEEIWVNARHVETVAPRANNQMATVLLSSGRELIVEENPDVIFGILGDPLSDARFEVVRVADE